MLYFLCMQQCAEPGIHFACGQARGGTCGPRLSSAGAGANHHHVLHTRLRSFPEEQTSRRLVTYII